ncbi:MAG: glutamyl-tRNA amidotransferase [Gammaproteobacteria bacterium CG22_combo_CG10-13_8_21_14_all_40_8]|nr:MAG: glutamyl-tRNA amidotransferase [Gammaproteobacteria bacterium CG22_combo_CG10-13_8_21_14_all_40_8]
MTLIEQIKSDMKDAMRAKQADRLKTIRLILAAFKQIEVDQRIEIDDSIALGVIDKMLKQRKDSISQFQQANRQDLVDIEQAEAEIIQAYLPEALSDEEIEHLVINAVHKVNAESVRDMGKVMGILKPQVQGKADMGFVGALVKKQLEG